MEKITVVTATYNREKELNKLYKSLCEQTCFDFIWLIIDDGSKDNTKEVISSYKTDLFKIEYVYQNNAGKHIALNNAFNRVSTELLIIVDSDDTLIPEAIETILFHWEKYRNNEKVAGVVFRRMYSNGKIVGDKFKKEEFEDNYNSYIINKGISGDKAEVFRTSVFKQYNFPHFKGEKFLGEGALWSKIAREYNMIFIDKAIYVCEYLDNGLTKSGRALRVRNPHGGMYHAEEYLDHIYKFKVREINAMLYLIYARFTGEKILEVCKKNKNVILLYMNIIPSSIVYYYWKFKYGDDMK